MLNGLGDPEVIETARMGLETEFGIKVRFHGADMTRPGEIAVLVESTACSFGAVDILVNNAGIQHTAPVEAFPPESWAAIIAVNLSSSFYTIHHAVPHMRRSGWGRIIDIASVHGLVASARKAAYVAAKHGLVGLTKVVALETAGSGITSNAICPGWTRTELIEPQIVARAQALGVDIEGGGAACWQRNNRHSSLSRSSNSGNWRSFSVRRAQIRLQARQFRSMGGGRLNELPSPLVTKKARQHAGLFLCGTIIQKIRPGRVQPWRWQS